MSELEDDRFYEAHADFCSVCANANRLKLIDLLRDGDEYSVSELQEASDISQSTISQHLKLMRDQGIVTRNKEGLHNYYSIADKRIVEGIGTIREVVHDRMDD
jgi:DNA-binding transcriptional ArsR family regulator